MYGPVGERRLGKRTALRVLVDLERVVRHTQIFKERLVRAGENTCDKWENTCERVRSGRAQV